MENRVRDLLSAAPAIRVLIGLLATVIALVCVGLFAPAAKAETSPGTASSSAGLAGNHENTFYIYVRAGEHLRVNIELQHPANTDRDFNVAINGMGGVTQNYARPAGTAAGSTVNYTGPVATQDGIWRVQTTAGSGSTTTDQIWSWSMGAYNGGTLIPGRVWTGTYIMGQRSALPPADVQLWYANNTGHIYRALYRDFNGIISRFYSNATGVTAIGGDCTPLYYSTFGQALSANIGNDPTGVMNGNCTGSDYRIFFAQPNADLPQEAVRWDGQTAPIVPAVQPVTVDELGFTYDGNASQLSGEFKFRAQNYLATATILVDTNNNGSFTDPVDRAIPFSVQSNDVQTLPFNGLNGQGNPIPLASTISFKVVADRPGEIHFTNLDVEHRAGGIEVERLNGSSSDRYRIYYNDSLLGSPRCGTAPSPLNTGAAGISSLGGVHRWDATSCPGAGGESVFDDIAQLQAESSWGNTRLIDEWTYDPGSAVESLVFTAAPALHVEKTAKKDRYKIGQTVEYTLTITNRGVIPTYGPITLKDTLPSQLSAIAKSLPSGCSVSGQVVTCVLNDTIGVNQSTQLKIKVKATEAGNNIVNNAYAFGGGDEECTSDTTLVDRCRANVPITTAPTVPNTGYQQFLTNPLVIIVLAVLAVIGIRKFQRATS